MKLPAILALAGTAVLMMALGIQAQQQNGTGASPEGLARTQTFQNPERVIYRVAPDDADPQVHRYLAPNFVLVERGTPATAPVLLFLPGTGGRPFEYWPFLVAGSRAGFRVIGLEYDDVPAVAQICQPRPDASCAGQFRAKRIFGDDVSKDIDDTPEETIVHRLTKLLQFLDAHHPEEGWGGYLVNGQPNWARIAVAGHSQGAGMAAFIAQRYLVARAVLLSSPWDHFGSSRNACALDQRQERHTAGPLVRGLPQARARSGNHREGVQKPGHSGPITSASLLWSQTSNCSTERSIPKQTIIMAAKLRLSLPAIRMARPRTRPIGHSCLADRRTGNS